MISDGTRPNQDAARSLIVAVALLVAAAVLVAGCAGPRLHTVDVEGDFCAGVGLEDATLHGSPVDPRVAWIEMKGFGEQQALFPKGFTARFVPNLEVLDRTGTVVFREGDSIDGACGGSEAGLLIGWP